MCHFWNKHGDERSFETAFIEIGLDSSSQHVQILTYGLFDMSPTIGSQDKVRIWEHLNAHKRHSAILAALPESKPFGLPLWDVFGVLSVRYPANEESRTVGMGMPTRYYENVRNVLKNTNGPITSWNVSAVFSIAVHCFYFIGNRDDYENVLTTIMRDMKVVVDTGVGAREELS
jgi:hypothetical protein